MFRKTKAREGLVVLFSLPDFIEGPQRVQRVQNGKRV